MFESELVDTALSIAEQAHAGQTDKAGLPYILHPIHVAEQQFSELATVVALLHDVVEDTEWTFDDLIDTGIPQEAVDSLRLLTHQKHVPYLEYIQGLAHDPIARAVKLADLEHNMDTSRLNRELTERELQKQQKYAIAHDYLSSFEC